MLELLRIVSASLTCLSLKRQRTSLVTTQIASTLLVIDKDKGSILVSRRYALKTSKVSTMLLGPAKLLTALTAICSTISLLICLSFSSS